MASKALGSTQARIHALDANDMIVALEHSGISARSYTPFSRVDDLARLADASGNPVITALAK